MKHVYPGGLIDFVLIFFLNISCSFSQNALGIKNLDILNISQSIDWKKITLAEVHGSVLRARTGFKWVQLQASETYILLPDAFQDEIVDFRFFLPGAGRKYTLDRNGFSYRISCLSMSGSCVVKRKSRLELQCNCPQGEWKNAPFTSKDAILIPAFIIE